MSFLNQTTSSYPVTNLFPMRCYQTDRDPTSADFKQFRAGDFWIADGTNRVWFLEKKSATAGFWIKIGSDNGEVESITGDTGGPVSPDPVNFNINLLGHPDIDVAGNPGTFTLQLTDLVKYTPYVVDPIPGQAPYQTIQSALDAANAAGGGLVLVRPATYVENLTLYDNVNILGADGVLSITGVTIDGTHVPPTTGYVSISSVILTSAGDLFSNPAAGSNAVFLVDCFLTCNGSYIFNMPAFTGASLIKDCFYIGGNAGLCNFPLGALRLESFFQLNSSSTPSIIGVQGLFNGSKIYGPLLVNTSGQIEARNCSFLDNIDFENAAGGDFSNCYFSSSSACITNNSIGSQITLIESAIDTTNDPSMSGVGTSPIKISGVSFVNNNNVASTLTLVYVADIAANCLKYEAIAFVDTPYTASLTDHYISVDTTGGAVTVLLPDAPITGRIFVVKDRVGNAAVINITVTSVGGAITFDGALTYTMNSNYQKNSFIFNGTSYEVG